MPDLSMDSVVLNNRRPGALRFSAIVLWAIILVVVMVRLGVTPTKHTVYYPLFQDTGKKWVNGEDVYDRIGEFRYCPLVAAFFGLLYPLPLRLAELIWLLPNLLLMVAGIYGWLVTALPGKLSTPARWVIALLATPMMIGNLSNLQANPMVLGLMLLATVTTLRGRFTAAALAITVATLLKIYPLGLGLLFLLIHPRKFFWRLPLFVLLGCLAPFLTQHPDYVIHSYQRLFYVLMHDSRLNLRIEDAYRDASIIWLVIFGYVNPTLFHLYQLFFAAMAGVATLWARGAKIDEPTRYNFILHLFTLWILMAGPSTESATFILGAPLAAWLLVTAWHTASVPFRLAASLGYGLLCLAASLAWLPYSAFFKPVPLQATGCIYLLIALLIWIAQHRPTPEPVTPVKETP